MNNEKNIVNLTEEKLEVITENEDPAVDLFLKRNGDSKMDTFRDSLETKWSKFANSFKKHLSLMIIFVLLGCALGLYFAKIIYNFRMDEIAQLAKTGPAGYVHNNQIYDVKLRP